MATIAVLSAIPPMAVAAGRRRWMAVAGLILGCGAIMWAAFGTADGYVRINHARLEAIVAEIETYPNLVSISLGSDDTLTQDGRTRRFDSYRFINEHLVTHYRRQVAPDAPQPVLDEAELLQGLGVPLGRYRALRASLERVSLSGFDRAMDGQIGLYDLGSPWVRAFVYSPTDEVPSGGTSMQGYRRLAPRWFQAVPD